MPWGAARDRAARERRSLGRGGAMAPEVGVGPLRTGGRIWEDELCRAFQAARRRALRLWSAFSPCSHRGPALRPRGPTLKPSSRLRFTRAITASISAARSWSGGIRGAAANAIFTAMISRRGASLRSPWAETGSERTPSRMGRLLRGTSRSPAPTGRSGRGTYTPGPPSAFWAGIEVAS